MTHVARFVWLSLVVSLAAGCARGLYGPSLDTTTKPAPRDLDELSVSERRNMLDRAEVWRPIATEKLNLLKGPDAPNAIEPGANVSCGFHYPNKPLSGVTPKFECELAPDDVVKVKYGENNGEVFAEVAATRLFWALGFFVDRMYPVKVTCTNCPSDPHRVSATEWHLGKPSKGQMRVYDPAAIERKFEGEELEVPGFEGWSWRELEDAVGNERGASRAEVDALKLLAAFIQHVDSKPENQALMCPDGADGRDAAGNETCARPVLIIKDLGSSFAEASKLRFPKMKLASWRDVPVWKDAAACRAELTSSIVGTLQHPVISEAGRKFLAGRMMLLSDAQLRDLFTVTRVDRRKDKVDGRAVTADDWVRAFKEKRAQIANHTCPA